MRSTKVCLFGGALMAAGLTAQAQEFIHLEGSYDGSYTSLAYSYAYGGTFNAAYAPDALNTLDVGYSYFTGTTTVSTHQSSTELRVQGSWAGDGAYAYGFGTAFMQQFFQVTEDAQLLISWDLQHTDGYGFAGLFAGDTELFILNPVQGGSPLVGSVLIDVSAGVEYLAVIDFYPFFFQSDTTQFISMTVVPTPASAGLLAAGGLLAARRRR